MKFTWPDSAQSDLRAIHREVAIRILQALTEYGAFGKGDIKPSPADGILGVRVVKSWKEEDVGSFQVR